MDVLGTLIGFLQALSSVPAAAKILTIAILVASIASGIVTAFVALWHSAVLFVSALAAIPSLSMFVSLANAMKADESKISDFANGKILPILNRFSVLPMPSKAAPALLDK